MFLCHPQTTKLANHWYNICLDLLDSFCFIKLASVEVSISHCFADGLSLKAVTKPLDFGVKK